MENGKWKMVKWQPQKIELDYTILNRKIECKICDLLAN